MAPFQPAAATASRWGRSPVARPRAGFTLVEIMIVVAILGIVLAMGFPPFLESLEREPIRQAVKDVTEQLSQARARAILRGVPYQFVLRPSEDLEAGGSYEMTVLPLEPVRERSEREFDAPELTAPPTRDADLPARRLLDPSVAVTFLAVNFKDAIGEGASEIHVVFHPNGTCDDFAMILEAEGRRCGIDLDPITSLAQTQMIP